MKNNKIKILSQIGVLESQKEDIYKLLSLCDKEFIPNLSARTSSTQEDFISFFKNFYSLDDYFNNICKQSNYFLVEENRIIGFMSFIKDYKSSVITRTPNIYISTIIIHPDFRKKGLCKMLYKYMLDNNKSKTIYTRTWSTNFSHINILLSLGFKMFFKIKNDRGRGVDTVYFYKNNLE